MTDQTNPEAGQVSPTIRRDEQKQGTGTAGQSNFGALEKP